MNREAAALGVPVYTTYGGRLGGVDEELIRQGRLRPLTDPRALELDKRPAGGAERYGATRSSCSSSCSPPSPRESDSHEARGGSRGDRVARSGAFSIHSRRVVSYPDKGDYLPTGPTVGLRSDFAAPRLRPSWETPVAVLVALGRIAVALLGVRAENRGRELAGNARLRRHRIAHGWRRQAGLRPRRGPDDDRGKVARYRRPGARHGRA